MDYFDSFDCQAQCEEHYSDYYANFYNDDCYCTSGGYFEDPITYAAAWDEEEEEEFEALYDEI